MPFLFLCFRSCSDAKVVKIAVMWFDNPRFFYAGFKFNFLFATPNKR